MRYINFYLFISLSLLSCKNSTEPKTIEPANVEFILYDDLDSKDIRDVSTNIQNNYARILSDLKVDEILPITLKIWRDYSHFLEDMENDLGQRYTGATGYIYGKQEIRLFHNEQVATAAVHEFAHVVSLYVNPTISNNPRWLWEAVALYENNELVDPNRLSYMVSGDYPTLQELNTAFNNSSHKIYSVGYTLIEYIISKWEMDEVIELIKTNGNIQAVLSISDLEFEEGWYEFVKKKYLN